MAGTSYTCTCGATLRYKQDLEIEQGQPYRSWKCRQCGTPVPGRIGEKLGHQHPQ